MSLSKETGKGSIVYCSHGGGPLPILGDPGHTKMVRFLECLSKDIHKPEAILVISAHWEEARPSIIGGQNPDLLYDYYGFPAEAYSLAYKVRGNRELALRVRSLLGKSNIEADIDTERGFDHGVFIPLMLMYPEGNIPTTQLSLERGLDPQEHINLGEALRELQKENILIIGSGFSFHNLNNFSWSDTNVTDPRNDAFQDRLIEVCTKTDSVDDIKVALAAWQQLPHARYCHPREEHLLPLHVCFGMAGKPGKLIFDDYILGKRSIALLWE